MELVLRNKFIKQVSKLPKEIQDAVNKDLTILGQSDITGFTLVKKVVD